MSDAQADNAERTIGALARHWASLPLEQRTYERYRLLCLAIDAALKWLAPLAEPTTLP